MLVAIHQPNFMPWFGYFYKMAEADVFVLYDDAQYTKGGYINRCLIKTPKGQEWLTIAVATAGHLYQPIREVLISPGEWRARLINKLAENYKTAPHFKFYISKIENVLAENYTHLADLNIRLLEFLRQELNIQTRIILASELRSITGSSTARLVSICQALGATAYLSGTGGKKYQDEELFASSGIRLEYRSLTHPVYPQLWGEFRPGLSIMDLMFTAGPAAAESFHAARERKSAKYAETNNSDSQGNPKLN